MDVSRIVGMLESELYRSFPGLHAFIGCDKVDVSAFSGKVKVTALKLVKQNKSFQTRFKK